MLGSPGRSFALSMLISSRQAYSSICFPASPKLAKPAVQNHFSIQESGWLQWGLEDLEQPESEESAESEESETKPQPPLSNRAQVNTPFVETPRCD